MLKSTAWYFDVGHNFGDMLTPVVLEHFGIDTEHVPEKDMHQAEIIGIGSILQAVPATYGGRIWSSGLIADGGPKVFQNAKVRIYGVRGKHTAGRLAGHANKVSDFALGDGGLLLSDVIPAAERPHFKLGIVPHYVDYEHVKATVQMAQGNPDVTVIDLVNRNVAQVAQEIAACDMILSSSLHGLVVADAYGIPSRQFRIQPTSKKIAGGNYKYKDYYSAFGMVAPRPLELLPSTTPEQAISAGVVPKNVEPVKWRLRRATERLVRDVAAARV